MADAEQAELCPPGWTCEPSSVASVLTGKPRDQVNDYASSSPLELLVAVRSPEGDATVVVRDGPTLAGHDPTESMVRIAGLISDVDRVDAEDIAAIDAIWAER